MTNYFNKPKPIDTNRNRAVDTVQVWLWGRTHLPKDLVHALHLLIPELKNPEKAEDF